MKKTVFITGATGTMGWATVQEFLPRMERFRLTLLARPSKKNRKKLAPLMGREDIRIVWGDLKDPEAVAEGVRDADYVLHIGGMVSPAADWYPELTLKTNVAAARNIAAAVTARPDQDKVKVCYIGSIAQLGDRRPPHHWGRTGDPLTPSKYDAYAVSKILAERAIVDSGIKHWVCFRQTGILCPELLLKGSDPITFHVPLRGVLEWSTAEDSGRLMANLCDTDLPDSFWNRYYNIGSGESYRLTNYEFEALLLKAMGCPRPEKVFDASWFALKNFHGQWWEDSDRLEELLHFRSGKSCEEYFEDMAARTPWYFKLAPLAPAALIKMGMGMIAKKDHGTRYYLKNNDQGHIEAMYGSRETYDAIPSWSAQMNEILNCTPEKRGERTPDKAVRLDHGYDESKPASELSLADMRQKAAHEGGECLSEEMRSGDLATPLRWRCRHGHEFTGSPSLILHGGHWCPECLKQEVLEE